MKNDILESYFRVADCIVGMFNYNIDSIRINLVKVNARKEN